MPNKLMREGTSMAWFVFMVVYILAALGLDIYWLFTESGPIRWIAEQEAKMLGGRWFPKVTFLVLLLAELVPLFVLKLAIEKITGTKLSGDAEEAPPANPPA